MSEIFRQSMPTLLPIVALSCFFMLQANGASAERRQTNLPMDCSPLFLDVNVTTTTCPELDAFHATVGLLTSAFSPEWNTDRNRAWLQDTLDDFCTSECLDYTLKYYSQNCSWTEEYGMSRMSLYRDYYCGSSNTSGEYCLVEIMEYMTDTTVFLDLVQQCSSYDEDFCSSLCMGVLEGFLNELGCCAVNLFNTTSQTSFPYEFIYETCGLELNAADMCSGAGNNSLISLLLLVVVTSLPLFRL